MTNNPLPLLDFSAKVLLVYKTNVSSDSTRALRKHGHTALPLNDLRQKAMILVTKALQSGLTRAWAGACKVASVRKQKRYEM